MTFSAERAYYENSALWEPRLYVGEQEERSSLTAKWLPADVYSVLDAGCGNGILTNVLNGQAIVVGLDRSFAALQWVNPSKCQGDLVALPFADNAFDAVVSTEVLEHLPAPLFTQVLDEMARVTRRYILVSVPYDEDLEIGRVTCPSCGCRFHRNYHMRKFTEKEIRDLFRHNHSVQLWKTDRIFATYTSGAKLVRQRWQTLSRCFGLHDAAFGDSSICPQCNYSMPADTATAMTVEQVQSPSRLRLKSFINTFVPGKKSYRWWLAMYRKTPL